jgi:PQQ-like domain
LRRSASDDWHVTGDTLAVIDLGDDFAPRDEPARSRRGRRRKVRRLWVLAAIVVALLGVGGASGARPGRFTEVARIPASVADSYQLFEDSLYVWDDRQPRTQTQLTRYGLDGKALWHRLVAGNGPETFVLETVHETIIDANLVDGVSHVMGLDRVSGALLWDDTATFGNGYPFIQMVDPRGRLLVYEAGNHGSRLRWVNSRTGDTMWQVDLPNGWSPDFQSQPAPGGKIWLVSLGGEVMSVKLDDHGGKASHQLPGLGGGADSLDYRTVTAGHGLVLVTDVNGVFPQQQYATLHAYDGKTLDHLWDDAPDTNASSSFCGDQICETSNVGLNVVDPKTGHHLWNTASEVIFPTGGNLIVGPYSPAGLGKQTIVEAATGRKIADITAWSFVQVGQSLLLTQPTRGFVGVWLARLAAGETRPAILGSIPGMSTRCVATSQDIACHALDGTIVLWRTN